jgi:hypothetical protein
MKTIVAACLFLPFAANATILYVDYEGVIYDSSDPEYALGDVVSGSLLVDTSLAPPDPTRPGRYGRPSQSPFISSADFITGFQHGNHAADQSEADYVDVTSTIYSILDAKGCCIPYASMLALAVRTPEGYRFERPFDIVQSFEMSSTAPPAGVQNVDMAGYIEKTVDGVFARAAMALTRFSVTPTPGRFDDVFVVCRK